MDIALISQVTSVVDIPVIASGGAGTPGHLAAAINEGHADAVAVADMIHFDRTDLRNLRRELMHAGISLRSPLSEVADA